MLCCLLISEHHSHWQCGCTLNPFHLLILICQEPYLYFLVKKGHNSKSIALRAMTLVMQLYLAMMSKYSKFGVVIFHTYWVMGYIDVFAQQQRRYSDNNILFPKNRFKVYEESKETIKSVNYLLWLWSRLSGGVHSNFIQRCLKDNSLRLPWQQNNNLLVKLLNEIFKLFHTKVWTLQKIKTVLILQKQNNNKVKICLHLSSPLKTLLQILPSF